MDNLFNLCMVGARRRVRNRGTLWPVAVGDADQPAPAVRHTD